MPFVHLHGHSTFSFLEAIGAPKQIAAQAKKLEMPAIAITDYHGMYGAISFFQSAKNEEIKAIIGVEAGFVLDLESAIDIKKIGNICLLAQNKTGYHNLLKLTSYANMEGLDLKQKIDISALQKRNDGVIVFFGGIESWIGNMIMRDEKPEKILEVIEMLKNAVGADSVYGEIIAQDYDKIPQLKKINEKVADFCQQAGLKMIVSNNFHYIKKDDKDAREMALAIKDGYKMYEEQRRKPKGIYHIATEEEISKILQKNGFLDSQIQELIATNYAIAESVETDIDLYQSLFPNYESPQDMIDIYEKYKDGLVEEK